MSSVWNWIAIPRHGWQFAVFLCGALVIGCAVLMLLTSTPPRYRKTIVAAVTFLAGLYYALEFLIPPALWPLKPPRNPLSEVQPLVATLTQIIWSFALLLGVWNLFLIHGRAVAKHGRGWYNSAAFFISFFAILGAGLLKDYAKNAGLSKASESIFTVLFSGFLTSLDATMFSLIAFYIVSAAYRAFRVKSLEAALMMAAAAIIMLALVPVGAEITNWLPQAGLLSALRVERIGYWLLTSPNMAAQRAIAFGIAVGSLAMGLRIWLSLERGNFFDRQL
ncbi:MAG: hypothetical protein QHI38_02285 [Armatimonadota bacterium]|nr:hypothetical protein [Armatimonadota bacterium]